MQGGRRVPNTLFDFEDPFAGLGFGIGPRSMLPSFFGGRDPFDDPFFTRPFGSPFGSLFHPGMIGPMGAGPFGGAPPGGFLEHQRPQPNKRKGPIIEEIYPDAEKSDGEENGSKKDNTRKHNRSEKEPYVEEANDLPQEVKIQHMQHRNVHNGMNNTQSQPQSRSFTFHSSTVTYGGADGACFTKSNTRRVGSDGVTFEEFREADSSVGQATHRISRGLNNKGHTLTRKLKSDGRVDSMQTLHNLDEGELTGFEEAWKMNTSGQHLSGWSQRLEGHDTFAGSSGGSEQPVRGGWALPCTQHTFPQVQPSMLTPDMAYATGPNSQPHQGRRNVSNGCYKGRMRP